MCVSVHVCVCGAGVPGRPAQLAAHLCSRLCAACAHALPTAPHHGKKTQERGMLRDKGRDGRKQKEREMEGRRREWGEQREEQRGGRRGDYKAGSMEDGKGSKRKWERKREPGCGSRESA